jgi:hypothetical protein
VLPMIMERLEQSFRARPDLELTADAISKLSDAE